MKKIIKPLILMSALLLAACNNSSNSHAKPAFYGKSDILFTEFLVGNSSNDRALEISNISAGTKELNDYSICIYKQNKTDVHIRIDLNKYKIEANSSFVISYTKSNEEILNKANFVTDDLMIDGTWSLSLNYKDKIVDVLGDIGFSTNYGKQTDLVRKNEYMQNKASYDSYDWIKYRPDDYSHLGNYEAGISEEELLEGPKLTEEMRTLPFVQENGNGGGGFVEVTLAYTGDGDTTNFYFPDSLRKYDISSRESIRYLRINTPEIQHGSSIDAQPWGNEAKKYNNQVLNKAKKFIIQTEKDNALRETYGRMLAYVWYSDLDDPKLSDYRCLNCEMLRVGLATVFFSNDSSYINPLLYKGLTYASIFSNAEAYAKKLGLKVHGEKDPNFNY